jgi:hypothetical protein
LNDEAARQVRGWHAGKSMIHSFFPFAVCKLPVSPRKSRSRGPASTVRLALTTPSAVLLPLLTGDASRGGLAKILCRYSPGLSRGFRFPVTPAVCKSRWSLLRHPPRALGFLAHVFRPRQFSR